MFIINLANNHSLYVPEISTSENAVETCFNCSHPDCLPYLHKITYKFADDDGASTGPNDGTLTQFIKEMIK